MILSAMNSASDSQTLPIPKGNSPYALAKRAEYMERDIWKAKALYQQAIQIGERKESAVKDLASLLHQQGETKEACDLLLEFKSIFSDQQKFCNLLQNLNGKLVPTGNCLNKQIKVFPLGEDLTVATVVEMFRNPSRISEVEILDELDRFALVTFPSHSAARKTLSTFCKWSQFTVEWVNIHGEVVGPAGFKNRKKRTAEDELIEDEALLLGRELLAELY